MNITTGNKKFWSIFGLGVLSLTFVFLFIITQLRYESSKQQLEETDVSAASKKPNSGGGSVTTSSVCARGWFCTQAATYQFNRSDEVSTDIDSNNYPHVSTIQPYSSNGWNVEYSYMDQSGWHTETAFTKQASTLVTELNLNSLGNPHILVDTSYNSNQTSIYVPFTRNAEIHHIFKDSSGWQSELVVSKSVPSTEAGPSFHFLFSSTIDKENRLHMVYFDRHAGKYVYAHQNSTEWIFEDLEDTRNWNYFQRSSIAIDSNNNPHILLNKIGSSESKLVYMYKGSSGWQSEDLGNNMIFKDNQIKIDKNNRPHILYTQGSYYNPQLAPPESIVYAFKDSSGWQKENVETDSKGSIAEQLSLELDNNDYPHIAYNYFDNLCKNNPCGALVYTYKDAAGWHKTVVEQAKTTWYALASRGIDIALDSQDKPNIVYTGSSLQGTTLGGGFRHTTR